MLSYPTKPSTFVFCIFDPLFGSEKDKASDAPDDEEEDDMGVTTHTGTSRGLLHTVFML